MVLCQIGGFRPDIQWYHDSNFAEAAMAASHLKTKDGSVELILGIRDSGASALLIDEQDYQRLQLGHYRRPSSKRSFLSLSPIRFASVTDLDAKLKSLKPKGKTKGRDDSQANKIYSDTSGSGWARATFEDARVFRRILTDPDFRSEKYGLSPILPWKRNIKIRSLLVANWLLDLRDLDTRAADPMVLDIGMAESDPMALSPLAERVRHIRCKRNINMQRGAPEDFAFGSTEILDEDEMYKEIRSFCRTDDPLVLLVLNSTITKTILKKVGISEEEMFFGFDKLFKSQQSANYRSRSRSPQRSNGGYERRRDFAENHVHIIDVQEMFVVMSTINQRKLIETTRTIAKQLNLEHIDPNGWCAGNEAVHLLDIFKLMADGPSIDEQRAVHDARPKPVVETNNDWPDNPDDIVSDYGGESSDDEE